MTAERSLPANPVQYYGDFKLDLPLPYQNLTLVLSQAAGNLEWRDSNANAEHLAGYLAAFFPDVEDENSGVNPREEMRSSISYIANELIENAVKFHYDKTRDVTIHAGLYPGEMVISATNNVDPATLPKFVAFVEELTSEEPGVLLIRQLESGLDSLTKTTSGIGFLTIMHDYQAKMGWKFVYGQGGEITVTTMVCLPVPEEFTLDGN